MKLPNNKLELMIEITCFVITVITGHGTMIFPDNLIECCKAVMAMSKKDKEK